MKLDVSAPVTKAMQADGGALPQTRIEGMKHVIAVASGKGGVGKSTVAANLAIALRGETKSVRVGLCDCDLYGPSMGLMFGTNQRPHSTDDGRIEPIRRHDIKLMSMGFLLDDATPAILRGPMVTRYTQQFLRSVNWGELDYLILDLPPGTGDIQLTIVQTVALSGAVIVTTPQEVALIDARKAASMFSKVNVPILGLVENMSYFLCPGDGRRYESSAPAAANARRRACRSRCWPKCRSRSPCASRATSASPSPSASRTARRPASFVKPPRPSCGVPCFRMNMQPLSNNTVT